MEGAQERLKFLGACGMFGESFRVISARKKLFFQITLAFILPLSFFFLAHSKVAHVTIKSDDHRDDNYRYSYSTSDDGDVGSSRKNYHWAFVLSFTVGYFTIVLFLSLLATAVVAYAVACHYSSRDITFKEVVKAVLVGTVWKRLVITVLWIILLFIVYDLIFIGLVFLCFLLLETTARPLGILLLIVLSIVCIVGIVYLSIVSEMALVGSVLENAVYGRAAISKSMALLKGKLWSVVGCFVLLMLCYGLVQFGFGSLLGVGITIFFAFGFVFLFVLAFENLVILVVMTIFYLVCKSYHHESLNITHLDRGGPVVHTKAAKDVQVEEQYQV